MKYIYYLINMETERFEDIIGYEGLYQIGTHGTVVSLAKEKLGKSSCVYETKQKKLIPQINKIGYNSVILTDEFGCTRKIDIHRLVALQFVDNDFNKPQVNHIDGNKSNNHISNLEWNTAKENMQHASIMGLVVRGETHHHATLTRNIVIFIKTALAHNTHTGSELARLFNTSAANISRIKRGDRWKHITI